VSERRYVPRRYVPRRERHYEPEPELVTVARAHALLDKLGPLTNRETRIAAAYYVLGCARQYGEGSAIFDDAMMSRFVDWITEG
jgi:hypothetical protein